MFNFYGNMNFKVNISLGHVVCRIDNMTFSPRRLAFGRLGSRL